MKIYIEYVILNNLTANAMILYIVGVIMRRKMSIVRILLSSIIGTIYAVLLPYISFNYDIGLKVILSAVMVAVGYKAYSLRDYMVQIVIFYVVTFMFGGMVIGIGSLMHTDILNILLYPNNLMATYMSLIIIALTALSRVIVLCIERHIHASSYYYDVNMTVGDCVRCVRGYLDSGNRLYHGIAMVVVMDKTMIGEVFDGIEPSDSITLSTINGTSSQHVYKIDEVELVHNGIHKNYRNIYAVESTRDFNDYDVLLHADM